MILKNLLNNISIQLFYKAVAAKYKTFVLKETLRLKQVLRGRLNGKN